MSNIEDVATFWDEQAPTFDNEADHGLADPSTYDAWDKLFRGYLGR